MGEQNAEGQQSATIHRDPVKQRILQVLQSPLTAEYDKSTAASDGSEEEEDGEIDTKSHTSRGETDEENMLEFSSDGEDGSFLHDDFADENDDEREDDAFGGSESDLSFSSDSHEFTSSRRFSSAALAYFVSRSPELSSAIAEATRRELERHQSEDEAQHQGRAARDVQFVVPEIRIWDDLGGECTVHTQAAIVGGEANTETQEHQSQSRLDDDKSRADKDKDHESTSSAAAPASATPASSEPPKPDNPQVPPKAPSPPKPKELDDNDDNWMDDEESNQWADNNNDASEGANLGDWNERFQRILSTIRRFDNNTPASKQIRANRALIQLARDFIYASSTYGKIIISEAYSADKTIKPLPLGGMMGGQKYIVQSTCRCCSLSVERSSSVSILLTRSLAAIHLITQSWCRHSLQGRS